MDEQNLNENIQNQQEMIGQNNANYNQTMQQIMEPEFMQQLQIDDAGDENTLASIIQKTKQLEEKQQIEKYILVQQEREVFNVFQKLHDKKKQLITLLMKQYNQKIFDVDIGLYEEFNELRQKIEGQMKTIQKLKQDIEKQGITEINNDIDHIDLIRLKNKREDMENQITIGRKFSSTQFIRDYLEKPAAYRVSYEDVKYEYQMRLRLKEALDSQKKAYQGKKEEISRAIKKQKALQQQLEQQRDYFAKLI